MNIWVLLNSICYKGDCILKSFILFQKDARGTLTEWDHKLSLILKLRNYQALNPLSWGNRKVRCVKGTQNDRVEYQKLFAKILAVYLI